MALILKVATTDNRIRAVLLNGSRANPKAKKDNFQDFDIVYIVNKVNTFLNDASWIDIFGERLIMQMPEEMTFGAKNDHSFSYLMLFADGNRIDLTIFPVDKLEGGFTPDSLSILLLDKDQIFKELPPPSEKDYLINRPGEKEFADCCNEFWWVCTYIAKGLCRNEITYAKYMLEIPVRNMFLQIIEWYIGAKTDFKVSFGKAGRNMKDYILPDLYAKILSTYPDSNVHNIWTSLFIMVEIFSDLANQVAQTMHFFYNRDEAHKVTKYLKGIYAMSQLQ